MMRGRLLAAVLAVALTGTACGDDKPRPAAKPPTKEATLEQRMAALLLVEEMPKGWQIDTETSDEDDDFLEECKPFAAFFKKYPEQESDDGMQAYTRGEAGPFLMEQVFSYPAARDATVRVADLGKAVAKCGSFTMVDPDLGRQPVTMKKVGYPRFGSQSYAFHIGIGKAPFRVDMTMVMVRVRNHALVFGGMTITTPKASSTFPAKSYQALIRKAVAKASKTLP